jgi:hypothetical protein
MFSLDQNMDMDSDRPNCDSEKRMLLKFEHLCLVLIALSLWFPAALLAQTKPHKSNAKTSSSYVPFVGCESDGDDGIQPAPEGESKAVALDGKDSKRLAYYQSERSAGVLAPRGWHGFGSYGLWGSRIIVTPDQLKIDASDVDADACVKLVRYDGEIIREMGSRGTYCASVSSTYGVCRKRKYTPQFQKNRS